MRSGDSATIDVAEPSSAAKGKAAVLAAPVPANRGWKKGTAIIDFVLRLGAITAALAAAATMGTSDENLPFFTQFFQFEASYDDMPTFQYVTTILSIISPIFSTSYALRHRCLNF